MSKALDELNRFADLADIPGEIDHLSPVNLSAYAMEALQGRLPMDFVAVYLAAALEDHRCWIREYCPPELKASAYSLDRVVDEIRKMVDPQGETQRKLTASRRGRGRPRKANTQQPTRLTARKREGIKLYEKRLSEGEVPKAALADAAAAAGMSQRNFERVLEVRRIVKDPEKLVAYLRRGVEERRTARAIAAAQAQFAKVKSRK